VTADRDVEHRLEDPELRREQPVHRRRGRVRAVADRLHGRGGIPALEEQLSGRVDNGRVRTAGSGLENACGAIALDITSHECESSTLKTRAILSMSIWRD